MRIRLLTIVPEQLPRLRGWSWTLFLIAWAGLLALGIYGTICGLADHNMRPSPEREYGVFASGNVVQMPFGAAATASGIRSGDHIVAVNGHSFDGATPSFHSMALKLKMPPVLELSTVSPDGRLMSRRLRRSSADVSQVYDSSGIGIETSRRFIVVMD